MNNFYNVSVTRSDSIQFASEPVGFSSETSDRIIRISDTTTSSNPIADSNSDVAVQYKKNTRHNLCNGNIHAIEIFELALTLYAVDKSIPRKSKVVEDDSKSRLHTRNIQIEFPTISKQVASAESAISDALSYMLTDTIQLTLSYHTGSVVRNPNASIQQDLHQYTTNSKNTHFDAVSLFSGGLDSTAGLYYNIQQGETDGTQSLAAEYNTFVFSSGSEGVKHLCEDTIDAVIPNRYYSSQNRNIIGSMRVYTGSYPTESTLFSRGLVYMLLGSCRAVSIGVQTVQVFENGLLIDFLPTSHGWKLTRTTHPLSVSLLNTALADVFTTPVQLTLPFRWHTKTDVCNIISEVSENPNTVVSTTRSCPHRSAIINSATGSECGLCLPCMIRYISLQQSTIDIPNLSEEFVFHPFANFSIENNTLKTDLTYEMIKSKLIRCSKTDPYTYLSKILELTSFSNRITDQTYRSQLTQEYPQLHDPQYYNLYQKFGQECTQCLSDTVPTEIWSQLRQIE